MVFSGSQSRKPDKRGAKGPRQQRARQPARQSLQQQARPPRRRARLWRQRAWLRRQQAWLRRQQARLRRQQARPQWLNAQKPAKRKRTRKQKMLLRQTLIQCALGVLMMVAFPKLAGYVLGGLLIVLGMLFAVMYVRDRRENG